MSRSLPFVVFLLSSSGCLCGLSTLKGGGQDAGEDAGQVAGQDGGAPDSGIDAGSTCGDQICGANEACSTCPGDCGLCLCPVVGGIDGAGLCSAWVLGSWDSTCTAGYTRTRTCDTTYDCRVSDHNGCDAPLNVGGSAPGGCPACPGGGTGGGSGGGGGNGGTLQYFGYWRDSDIQNFVCQIQDHVNFSMTGDSQAIVDLAATFGVANFGLSNPTSGTPAALNVSVLKDDADAAAYGWCGTNPCPNGLADGWAAIKAQAEREGDAVRAQHPGAHLMINLADGDANGVLDFQGIPGFTLPRGVDWVGLECYTGAANCRANMNVLRPLLPPGGRAWVITAGASGYGTEAWLVNDAQAMYDWASVDPQMIGMLVFVWSRAILCPPDCTALAVKEMPLLLAKYRDLGDRITGRGAIQPKADSMCPPP